LQIAVGVAKAGSDEGDVHLDADGLANLSSTKLRSGSFISTGLLSRISN